MDSLETINFYNAVTGLDLVYNIFCLLAGLFGVYISVFLFAFKSKSNTREMYQKYLEDNYVLVRISYFSYLAVTLFWFFNGMEMANFWFFTFNQFDLNMATLLIGLLNHKILDYLMILIKKVTGKWGIEDPAATSPETKPEEPAQ